MSNFRNFYTLIIKPNNSFVLSLSPLSCYLVALHVQVSLFCSVIVQILRPLSLSSLFTGFTNSEETFAILFIRFKTNVDWSVPLIDISSSQSFRLFTILPLPFWFHLSWETFFGQKIRIGERFSGEFLLVERNVRDGDELEAGGSAIKRTDIRKPMITNGV